MRSPIVCPLVASSCRALLIVGSLLVLCLPALAQGSYVAHYSGSTPPAGTLAKDYNKCSKSGSGANACEMSATLVWTPHSSNPGEPPPQSAVVTIQGKSSVGGGGPPTSGISGDCNDGQGAACPMFTHPTGVSGSVTGPTKYSVAGGASITIPAKPKAELKGSPGPISGGVYAELNVSATPIVITLNGGIGNQQNKRYLMGQLASASITNGGLTPVSYSWTVSGGEPFKSYAADTFTAVFTPLGSPSTQSSVQFYWKRQEPEATITCTVDLAKPGGGTLSATVDAKCAVDKPLNSLSAIIGTVQLVTPGVMQLWGGSYTDGSGNPHTGGIIWIGSVTTPPNFGGGGGWNYTQLVKPYRFKSLETNHRAFSLNGIEVLDTTFGYEPVYPDVYTSNGGEVIESDSPGTPLSGSDYVYVGDSFLLFTLYIPPGGTFTPLKNLEWYWKGKAILNPGGWNLSDDIAEWSFVGDFPAHPTWDNNVINGTYVP